jgi:hypothetical protein
VLVVNPPVEPCPKQAAAVGAAIVALQNLTDQLHALQMQQEAADHLERQRLQLEINDIQKKRIPAAQAVLAKAQKELQLCRAFRGRQLTNGVSNFE